MRYAWILLSVSVACSNARAPQPVAAPPPEHLLDEWHDAAAHADEERYFGFFAPNAVFLGTDATERWTLPQFRAFAHPHFAKGKAWSFKSVRRDVVVNGEIAWFDEDLATPNLGPARGSGVLVHQVDGTWKIAQYNLTITVPNEKMKAVKALIEGTSAPAGPP
jgi:hypothetical protein